MPVSLICTFMNALLAEINAKNGLWVDPHLGAESLDHLMYTQASYQCIST